VSVERERECRGHSLGVAWLCLGVGSVHTEPCLAVASVCLHIPMSPYPYLKPQYTTSLRPHTLLAQGLIPSQVKGAYTGRLRGDRVGG
jgi:hypothetical protein